MVTQGIINSKRKKLAKKVTVRKKEEKILYVPEKSCLNPVIHLKFLLLTTAVSSCYTEERVIFFFCKKKNTLKRSPTGAF